MGGSRIPVVVAHGEGRMRFANAVDQASVAVAARYVDGEGRIASAYPANPNGSANAVAAVCNETGRLSGLMPHPEAFLHRTNHPRWTRETLPEEGQGLAIFKNAASFIRGKEF